MPCWIPTGGEYDGFGTRSIARAVAAGLTFRPLTEIVEDMHFGTANGPIRLVAPVDSTVWCAVSMALVDGPPEPATSPVRGCEIRSSPRPASAIAWPIAI